ncbi:MAG: sigma 54-interacting transcriptional regulator, partial [Calditrichaeota bacterium]|nr:sigma 54-interacting transcriptional regulator [Calditrichota bacterium]
MTGSLKNKKNSIDSILGNSQAVHQVKSLIRQVAPSDITVLVSGESGTGKELAAKALHDLSRRKTGPLMTLNCGAIPEGIFESEIFGHEKGSFTSAEKLRKGYFELSDKG